MTLPHTTNRFFVDALGYLWAGPFYTAAGESAFKRFEGATEGRGRQVWRWLSEIVESNPLWGNKRMPRLWEISQQAAAEIVKLHVNDARSRKV